MHSLTRLSGLIFLILAGMALIMGFVDMIPEWTDAARTLAEGDRALPIATSVKYKIGGELVFDVLAAGALAIFGWFLFTSEIQQTWAVIITGIIVVACIVVRVTPLLPLSTGKVSPGLAFWGAQVYADVYRPPLKPASRRRMARTFPHPREVGVFVTKPQLSGDKPHPAETVVLDFSKRPALVQEYLGQPRGAKVTGALAGTRTILDYDFDKTVYTAPHLMVLKVEPLGSGG